LLKVVQLDDTKYVRIVYNVMCRDLAIEPNCTSWANSGKHLLLCFNNVWKESRCWKRKFVYSL